MRDRCKVHRLWRGKDLSWTYKGTSSQEGVKTVHSNTCHRELRPAIYLTVAFNTCSS